jgi:hypothetical protein
MYWFGFKIWRVVGYDYFVFRYNDWDKFVDKINYWNRKSLSGLPVSNVLLDPFKANNEMEAYLICKRIFEIKSYKYQI